MSRLCSLCFDLQTQLLRPHRLTNVLNTEYHRKCLDTLQKSLARQHLYYILKWFVGRIVSTGAPSFSLSTFQEIHMLHGWSKKWSLGQSNSPQSITRHNWRSSSKTESRSDLTLILMNCKVISQSNTFQTPFNLLYIEIKICCEFMFKKWSSSILSNFSN